MLTTLIDAFIPRQRAATVQSLGHPASGILGWLNVEDNSSGEPINAEIAYHVSAFWCGVRVISEILASLPCIMYERVGENDKRRATEDVRYGLVHDAPNEELDAYHFFEVSTAHQVVWGNSYSVIVRDGMNIPQSLELRLPDCITPERNQEGTLVYKCNNPAEEHEFDQMLHGVGFSYDGIRGYSLITAAAQSLGVAVATDKYVGATLRNGAVPSGVLDHPARLSKPAREQLRRDWDEIHSGAGKTSRLAITHGGIKYSPIAMNNQDAQLLETRKFNVLEIARWLRLPPYILHDLESSGVRANIEQQSLDLIAYSLMPWVKRWEGVLKMKLLRRDERRRFFFEFLLDSLLRGDTKTRFEAHAIARQWGWESVNDILRMENRNGIGPDGDVYLQPLNMSPAGMPPPVQKAALPETLIDEYRRAATDAVRETIEVGKEMKSALQVGLCDVQQAFAQFGGQLEQRLSAERDTFAGIKSDIAELGQKVAVRVPAGIDRMAQSFVQESLRVVLAIERTEALKAARAQMHDASQNFIKRMEAFYETHRARVSRSVAGHIQAAGADESLTAELVDEHVRRSLSELLECCDGDRESFEQRVTAAVDQWLNERLLQQSREYHARIYGSSGASQ